MMVLSNSPPHYLKMKRSCILLVLCFTGGWAFPKRNPTNGLDSRIINGAVASLGQFPWQVAMNVRGFESGWFCGGVIVHEEWILTAAHCIPRDSVYAYIWAGIINFAEAIPIAESDEFFPHENYNEPSLADDVGLIRVHHPFTFNGVVGSIPIAFEEIGTNVPITVSGFGAAATGGGIQNLLSYVHLTTITNSECRDFYGDAVTEGMVCARSDENPVKSPCHGDSGGPAITNVGSGSSLIGLVSWVHAEACESVLPQGYTRAVYYRDWIRRITGLPL